MKQLTVQTVQKTCRRHDYECTRDGVPCPLLVDECLVSRQPHEWDLDAIDRAVAPARGGLVCVAYRVANAALRLLLRVLNWRRS